MAWRVRIGGTVLTAGWFLMDDWNAFTIALLGFAACGIVVLLATIAASLETRVVRLRQSQERRR